jgi:hypothetical protein
MPLPIIAPVPAEKAHIIPPTMIYATPIRATQRLQNGFLFFFGFAIIKIFFFKPPSTKS